MKNMLKPLAKKVLILLAPTAAASAADAGYQKKIFNLGHPSDFSNWRKTSVISNEEVEDIIKIVKSLEEPGLLIKGVRETIENEAKEQKGGFLGMLFGTLGTILLGNLLPGKGATATSWEWGVIRTAEWAITTSWEGQGATRAGQNF